MPLEPKKGDEISFTLGDTKYAATITEVRKEDRMLVLSFKLTAVADVEDEGSLQVALPEEGE